MPHPRVSLRNPWIAAVLAFLVPGAGHLYQRRFFKSAVYFVCINGLFLYGLSLGEWKVVSYTQESAEGGQRSRSQVALGYLAQAPVGLAALPAIIQSKRYHTAQNEDNFLTEREISGPFVGQVELRLPDGEIEIADVTGKVHLEAIGDQIPRVEGRFVGTSADGESIELKLGDLIYIDRPIAASERRELACQVVANHAGEEMIFGRLDGAIPRRFVDWFEVPLGGAALERLHGRLGKLYELAMVYTWIAGLLNVLAIWDALEGPAYGLGDESENGPQGESLQPAGQTSTPSVTDESKVASAQS